MIDLIQSLSRQDIGYLHIVAYLWGLEVETSSPRTIPQQLAAAMTDSALLGEMLASLPAEARKAVDELVQNGGRISWPLFTRRYGAVREMGPARRDREKPHLNPASPAEILWYRAFIGRAFLDTADGPQEFACIPNDLLALLPAKASRETAPLGRPASPKERAAPIPASDRILDHACTTLAALRLGLPFESQEFASCSWVSRFPNDPSPSHLFSLLAAAGLIDAQSGMPVLEATRHFLEATRARALAQLARLWLDSPSFNELWLLPGLRPEGDWQNDPLRARHAVIAFLSTLPHNTWWSLPEFVGAIKEHQPDFQRPAGDYDSWHIADVETGKYLRGFDCWDQVDGALVRFLITGPCHWLGMIDLASPQPGLPLAAFRLSSWAELLLRGAPPPDLPAEDEALLLSSDARLRLPRLVPRSVRYQVARFTRWQGAGVDAYAYQITHASLQRAAKQGIQVSHILTLLHRHALAVPPNLVKALERWEKYGSEASLEPALLLRLRTPEMLQALRNSPAARFLGDPLGPTVVIVKPGAWQKVARTLAELGYFLEGDQVEQQPNN